MLLNIRRSFFKPRIIDFMEQIKIGQFIPGLERDHICGCGKGYLSYAALQQHVKIKHEGIFPKNSKSLNRLINGEKKPRSQPNFAQEFKKVFPDIEIPQEPMTEVETQQLFCFLRDKNLAYVTSFHREFQRVQEYNAISSSQQRKMPQNIYQIFSLFLLEIKPYCPATLFRDIFLILYMIICIFNKKGLIILQNSNQDLQIQEEKQYCLSGDMSFFSTVVNKLITNQLPIMAQKLREMQIETRFLGWEEEQLKITLYVVKKLSEWLFQKKFLSYRLEIDLDSVFK